jgi:hypothetical protein
MPMYTPDSLLPKRSATEGDFYKSLSYLKKHYGLKLNGYRNEPYPYNILLAEWEINRKLQTRQRYRELQIVEQDDSRTCLTVTETFRSQFELYYIPVMPIYELWQNPAHIACAELLTAVCAFLYIDAGVSYYRDEDTYIYYSYEAIKDWIEDDRGDTDENNEDYNREMTALKNSEMQGEFIQAKMMATGFRQSLDILIAGFPPKTDYEKACLTIAKTCWEIWQAYPESNLYSHASLRDYDVQDYDDNYVAMYEYISFTGSVTDILSDRLKNMVNDDFNERARYSEPEVITFFNEPQPAYTDALDFEYRVLRLIDDLCTLLYRKP